MEVWMILMTTSFFFGASFGQSSDPNEFSVNTYATINSELQKCAIPSAKMFDKTITGQDGILPYSTFDLFCYYEAINNKNQVALFMCKYYRFIVETYFDDYCKSDSPVNKPLDKSVQYVNFVSNPDAVCNYLQLNLQTADQHQVFNSPAECTSLCRNALEFCGNFGFALSIVNNNTNPEETNNDGAGTPEGNNEDYTNLEETNNDAAGTPEENNEVPLNAEGDDNTPPAEDQDDNTEELDDGVDEEVENPGDVQIDNNDGEDVNGTNDGLDLDIPAQQGGGFDFDVNGDGNNEVVKGVTAAPQANNLTTSDSRSTASTSTDTFNPNLNQNDGGQDLFLDDRGSDYSTDEEGNQLPNEERIEFAEEPQPNEETKETSGHSAEEQIEADRNILIEQERKLLEQESSSHFLAYSLTAIILVMVTYILYHNKQKIVAIIIEGRHGGQGKRRRYNQNVYTTLDETA